MFKICGSVQKIEWKIWEKANKKKIKGKSKKNKRKFLN